MIAGYAQVDGGIQNAGQLEAVVEFPLLALIYLRRALAGALEVAVDLLAHRETPDHQKIPRLHEPYGGRMMRGIENAAEHIVRHRIRQEMPADVAAFVDGAINAAALLV